MNAYIYHMLFLLPTYLKDYLLIRLSLHHPSPPTPHTTHAYTLKLIYSWLSPYHPYPSPPHTDTLKHPDLDQPQFMSVKVVGLAGVWLLLKASLTSIVWSLRVAHRLSKFLSPCPLPQNNREDLGVWSQRSELSVAPGKGGCHRKELGGPWVDGSLVWGSLWSWGAGRCREKGWWRDSEEKLWCSPPLPWFGGL